MFLGPYYSLAGSLIDIAPCSEIEVDESLIFTSEGGSYMFRRGKHRKGRK